MSDVTNTRLTPLPGLEKISAYVPGESGLDGQANVIKLSSNENALGASPKAIAAYRAAGDHLHLYPDGSARVLREAIGELNDIDPARVVCGAGSDEVLQILARAFVAPGQEVVYSAHGFMVYPLIARQCRAVPVAAPETNLTVDVDAILSAVTDKTRIVFIANPNNPTGTLLPDAEIRRLHAGLPGNVLLVLDAAYAEFVDRDDYDGGQALASDAPNVVMTRTFSKAYGLAAVRLGWMYGPSEIVDVVHRLRGPFNVTGPAIAAGVAAIGDQDHVRRSVAHNVAELAKLEDTAAKLGLLAVPSICNFTLLRFPEAAGKTASDADAFLKARGIILRGMAAYGLSDCLRVTVGREDENRRVIEALEAFMGGA